MPNSRSLPNIVIALIIGMALILCTLLITRALVRIKSTAEVIRVTGSARQPIRSDFVIWKGKITQSAPTVGIAYQQMSQSVEKVKTYLTTKGIAPAEITPAAIETKTIYAKTKGDANSSSDEGNTSVAYQKVVGYQLTEEIEVRSQAVDVVDSISRQSTQLISEGVPFESETPQYLYTKLSDLKVTILAAAAKDARNRAEQIAGSSGCRIGDVRFAEMGVLQIEPLYPVSDSSGISDEGTNDTTALDKQIIAVVRMGYSIR